MRKTLNTLIVSIMMILFCGSTLSAQEGMAQVIRVGFTTLNCESSYEEVNVFLQDYQQYQLEIMFWFGFIWHDPCCPGAYLVFNPNVISYDELGELFENDTRLIYDVKLAPKWLPRPRQLAIKLNEDYDEAEIIASYAEYGLHGSNVTAIWSGSGLRCFTFDDTVMYPTDFLKILKTDPRFEVARLQSGWKDGSLLIIFDEEEVDDFDALFSDYDFITFDQLSSSAWRAEFDFQIYNEFVVMEQLQNDPRFYIIILNDTVSLDGQTFCDVQTNDPPTSNFDVVNPIDSSSLVSVYPNPFNPSTTIVFEMARTDDVRVQIHNIRGQLVRTLVDGSYNMGSHSVVWNGTDSNNRSVSSGVYFLKFETNSTQETQRILLMK